MQAVEADNKNLKVSGDDENIKFRPSPNFKHMKKYLKSKFDEENSASNNASLDNQSPSSSNMQQEEETAASQQADNQTTSQQPASSQQSPMQQTANQPAVNHEPVSHNPAVQQTASPLAAKQEPVGQQAVAGPSTQAHDSTSQKEPEVQPPLPPHPPPPDSPFVIKTEREDVDEYSCNTETQEPQPVNQLQQSENPEEKEETGETMCRDYIRGICSKGAGCIFAHKVILSQLKGIRFCINFQNRTGCDRPHCKFVHASVFEKEYFYKTGHLPPHATAHLKRENPLPASQSAEEIPAEATPVFAPPAPPQVQIAATEPMKHVENSSALGIIDSRMVSEAIQAAVEVKSPSKREWSDIDDGVVGSQVATPSAKKCKTCHYNELRLGYIKRKWEHVKCSSEELIKKINALNRKNIRLRTILIALLSKKTGSGLIKPVNDSESILSRFELLSPTNRYAALNEESSKNVVAKLVRTLREMLEKN